MRRVKHYHNGKAHGENGGKYGLFHLPAALWQSLLIHDAQVGLL